MYLLENLRDKYISRFHRLLEIGHPGLLKTLWKLSRDYYFLGIKRIVEQVLRNYYVCRTTKIETYKLYGFI